MKDHATMDREEFDRDNQERIKAVERSFGVSGTTLSKPGRFLMGQGRLVKQGRRKPESKVFFLFNDVLVYGSIVMFGHLYKKQKIIALENIKLEDIVDNDERENQWLIRTPRKSFFVSADTQKEKQDWMENIDDSRLALLNNRGREVCSDFAVTWIPDQAAKKCMRCFKNFTATKRRHHCRKCGFLVCNACSRKKLLIEHIDPTNKVRACKACHTKYQANQEARQRGDSAGKNSLDNEDVASSDDEEGRFQDFQTSWLRSL